MEEMQKTQKRPDSDYPVFLFKLEDIIYPEKFNSITIGSYEDKDGKVRQLINADGRVIESGFITSRLHLTFNVSLVKEAQIVKFLMGSPENVANGGTKFSLTDTKKASANKDIDLIKELQLEQTIMNLDLRKLRAVTSSLGMNYSLEKAALQASVIRRVRTPQTISGDKTEPGFISVERIVNSKKTMILLEINQMIQKEIIKINNSGIYVHGNHNMGLNADQVVVYFDRNQPVYGILKGELRKALLAAGELEGTEEPQFES